MSIFDLYIKYNESEKEVSMLDSLMGKAQLRLDQAFSNIYNCFNESTDDLWRDISQNDILKFCERDPACDLYWVAATKNRDYPILRAIQDLKNRIPHLFEEAGIIVIEILVAEDFANKEQLRGDLNHCKELFSASKVYFVVKRDCSVSDLYLKGGVAIHFEISNSAESEDSISQNNTSENEEVELNGISSDDMVNFIREVVKEYKQRHPGINLGQLQRALSPIYNGRIFKFVEEKQKITKLAKVGDVYHSLAYSDTLDDGTEYVIYKELLRYRHLRKTIEFAKRHGII